MVLRNVALLITNDNRQGIMETIIVLLALLSQILGLFGFVFSCLLFLRFGKVKGWFNKKAGTEIVSSFSFRSLRTLIVTGVLGFVMIMVGLLCSVGLFIDKTPTDTQMYWFAGTFVALTLVCSAVCCCLSSCLLGRSSCLLRNGTVSSPSISVRCPEWTLCRSRIAITG